jgi:uncharacterized membrane protein
MYVKIKLFGYSFHPMLVAYPVVLYTATVVAFVIYQLQGELFWFRLGHVANKAGVMMALVTLVPGLLSWAMGMRREKRLQSADMSYMALNVGALVLFGITALMNAGEWNTSHPNIGLPLVLALAGVGLTIAAGFYGWTFVHNQQSDEATLWQWQARAARLTEELEQAQSELARVREELEQVRAQGRHQERAFAEPERPPSWFSMANQTWSALADRSWFASEETHANPAKLVLAIVVTVGAVAFFSLVPNLVGLR